MLAIWWIFTVFYVVGGVALLVCAFVRLFERIIDS